MRRILVVLALLLGILFPAFADNWPGFRGPEGNGYSNEQNLPVKWSPTENIRWKAPLPGAGNSSPVIWKDRVFLTQASDKGQRRTTMCLARADGKLLWEKDIIYTEKETTHNTNGYCSATPVTDGELVIVSHGSAGLVCYTMNGNQMWHKDLGRFEHIWGNAASPILYGDLCILNCGPGERTFLMAWDKKSGREVWKVEEPGGKDGSAGDKEWIGSWSTPVIINVKGHDELIMSWPEAVRAYDPKTGKLLWTCFGLSKLVYTSALANQDVVVAMSGYRGPCLAVTPGGSGDVTNSHRLWLESQKIPQRIGSGILLGEHVYMVNENGFAQCIEWKTGKTLWDERMASNTWGSMIHADGKLFVTNQAGETYVLAAKPKLEVLSKNPLNGEHCNATPAISDGEIFIRTYSHLWCIKKPEKPASR